MQIKITRNTRLNRVIGYPLTHSQSPLLHQTIYRELGIDAVLLAQPHFSLALLIQTIKTLSVELTAVTLPYKEEIIPYLDECSKEVDVINAVNTVIQKKGKLQGYNTDIDGIAFALRNINLRNKKVLIVGAGGSARAMGYFLKNQQADIFWMNRNKKKAEKVASQWGGHVIVDNEVINHTFDMIVNATPIGLYPNVQASPLSCDLFHAKQIVFDMVYNPVETTFLKQAQNKQARIISGLDMFIGQGLKQIELFTDKIVPPTQELISRLRQLLIEDQQR